MNSWPLIALIGVVLIVSGYAPRAVLSESTPLAGPQYTDVFRAGENGYHTYRIPSLIATTKGTLLAFAEGRKAAAEDAGDIDLVLKRSRDGGVSWSHLQIIGDNGPHTFGNPCPVVDKRTGIVWLLTTHNRGSDREKDIIAGTSAASRTIWVMKSDDDGVTWSTPIEITRSVKEPGWTWYATGPGVGIQTRGGRLVIPANHAESGTGIHRSHLFFSDDGGNTWKLAASAGEGTNESQIVELADGRLMLNMRNHPPKPENFRMVATSGDLGRTLSPESPDRTLIEPPAQASLIRLTTRKTHDRNRLLFANPASTRRERLTVRLSYDEGVSWPVSQVVHNGPAAYSSLAVLPDLSIGLLMERGEQSAYEKITLARFSLEWLTAGKDRISPDRVTGINLPSVPDAHGFAGAFAGIHNGYLLAAGGANFPDGLMPWNGGKKVWHDHVMGLELERPGATWREIGRLAARNGYGASITVREGVLIMGGGDAERSVADVRLLTIRGGRASLREFPALPQPLAQLAGAAVGRHVHVVGGVSRPDATTASASHYRLDLDAPHKGWQAMAPLPAPGRILAIAAGVDNTFYVFSGCSLSPDAAGTPTRTYRRDGWKFAKDTWTRVADLPRAATGAASPAPAADGSIFVISGDEGNQSGLASAADHKGFTTEILRYDTSQDRWHHAGTLGVPPPVTLTAVPWRDGFILLNGEIRPGVRTSQVVFFRSAH